MGTSKSGRRTVGKLFKRPSGVWALRYVVNGRDIRVSLDTTDAKEAKRRAAKYLHPVQADTEADRRQAVAVALETAQERLASAEAAQNRMPLSEVWKAFTYDHTVPGRGPRRPLSVRTAYLNQVTWAKFATWAQEHLGEDACIEDVTPETAAAFSKHMRDDEHLTAGRHNATISIVRTMFRLAGRPSPFATVPRYAVRYESRRNIEVEELRAICSTATGELRRLFALMVYTGLRLGDAATMDWSSLAHGRVVRRMAKTGKDVAFPIHPTLAAVLADVPEVERKGYVCPELAEQYKTNTSNLSRAIRSHLEACGLTCTEAGADRQRRISRVGAHAFRHAFITECARAGVPEGAIRDWVGHSSSEINRIYQHWGARDTDARILAALPAGAFTVPALLPAAEEPERAELRRLADVGTIAAVRAALAAGKAS